MKPVAWMRRLDGRIIRLSPEPVWDTDEPLYVAPRELTDEEVANYLQKKIDHLWQMTESNMKLNLMNIMDDIRLETIDAIKPAIAILKKASEHETE